MVDLILSLLDLFQWIFRLLKVDYPTLRLILWAKLTTDNRQEKSVAQRRSKKEISNAMVWVVFIYIFIGFFAGIMLIGIKSLFVAMVFVFAMVMVMAAVALISDFTSVLLDTTDNAILLPRPVDSRTLAAARIVHVGLYLLLITLSLSLATLLMGTAKYGPRFSLALLIALIFTVMFVVFLANVFYLLIIKVSKGDHFRDVILYFQIFMAAFAMGSYQLLPRLIQMDSLLNFNFPIRWWTFLVPPAWMAAFVDLAVGGTWTGPKLGLAAIGLSAPLISMVIVIRFLAPGFNQAISRLETGGSIPVDSEAAFKKSRLARFLSRLWARDPQERGIFLFCWRVTSQDRKFKLKTYPTFGYMLIIAFVLTLYNRDVPLLESLQGLPLTQKYIIFLYIGCLLIPIVILQQRFSDQYEAAWIFRTLPFSQPGPILKGSLKAMLAKYGVPVFVLLAFLVMMVWGLHTWDDVILGFLNMLLISFAIAFMVRSDLPFSIKYGITKDVQKGVVGFMLFLIPACAGIIHYALTFLAYGVLCAIPVSLLGVVVGMHYYSRIPWSKINM